MPESQLDIDGHRIELRRARPHEVVDLRHAVLRQGLARQAAIFDGDDAPTTRHYVAVHNGQVVCCVTLLVSRWEDEPAWQLRGMATAADWRNRGVGKALTRFIEADL